MERAQINLETGSETVCNWGMRVGGPGNLPVFLVFVMRHGHFLTRKSGNGWRQDGGGSR